MSSPDYIANGETIRATRETVKFVDGLTVDGYRMPNGEFRVSLSGASKILGYERTWLSQILTKESNNRFKALQGIGFSGQIVKLTTVSKTGDRPAKTIGLKDFSRLIAWGVRDGKGPALALQLALTDVALTDFFRDAFGDRPQSMEEKRDRFYQVYASTISPDRWKEMDCEDIVALALPGDEKHLADWNR